MKDSKYYFVQQNIIDTLDFKIGRTFEHQNEFEGNLYFNIYSIDGKHINQQQILVDENFKDYCHFNIIIPQEVWLKKWLYNYYSEKLGIESGKRVFVHIENEEQSIDEWGLQVFRVQIDCDDIPSNLSIQFHGLDKNKEQTSWQKDIDEDMHNFIQLETKFIVLKFTYSHLNEGVDSEIIYQIDVEKLEVKTNYLLLHLQKETINCIVSQLKNKCTSDGQLQNLVYVSSQKMDVGGECEKLLQKADEDFKQLLQSKLPERPHTSSDERESNKKNMNRSLECFYNTMNDNFQKIIFTNKQKESAEISQNIQCLIIKDFLPLCNENEPQINNPLEKLKQCQQILKYSTRDQNFDIKQIETTLKDQQQNVLILKQQFEKLKPQVRKKDQLIQIVNLLQRLQEFNQQMVHDINNVKFIQRQMTQSINQLRDEQIQMLLREEEVQTQLNQRVENIRIENDELRQIIEEKNQKLKEYNRSTVQYIRKAQLYYNFTYKLNKELEQLKNEKQQTVLLKKDIEENKQNPQILQDIVEDLDNNDIVESINQDDSCINYTIKVCEDQMNLQNLETKTKESFCHTSLQNQYVGDIDRDKNQKTTQTPGKKMKELHLPTIEEVAQLKLYTLQDNLSIETKNLKTENNFSNQTTNQSLFSNEQKYFKGNNKEQEKQPTLNNSRLYRNNSEFQFQAFQDGLKSSGRCTPKIYSKPNVICGKYQQQ